MDQRKPQAIYSNLTPDLLNMFKNNSGILNYTNKILEDWSKEVSNFGSLSNDGVERFLMAGCKNLNSGTSSRESFSDSNRNSDLDTSTQMLNSTHEDKMDCSQVPDTSVCYQENTIIKIEQDDGLKKEQLVENSNCEGSFNNNDEVSTRNVNNLDAEVRNSCTMSDYIKPDIEGGTDGMNETTDTVEGITNEIYDSLHARAVKNELECSQDNISSFDDLLIPHRVRSCSPHGDGEQIGPTSSMKYRTRSSTSSLPTNGMAKINYGIREKLRRNLPKNKEKKKSHNKPNTFQKLIEPSPSELVLTCNQCSYRTWNKKYMELHKHMHENDSGISFCHICDYVALDKNILIKHLIQHNGKAPFRCALCEFTSNIPSGLIKHSKLHHSDVTKPFTCNICEYKSANNSDVVRHTRTHTGVKPFACKQCPYRSTDSSSLTFHMRSHTGEKPYSCKLCDYRTKSNSGLISHMRTHTGEKPFTCKACEHRFANHSDLVRHMKINTTGKLLNCDSCGYNSAARCALVKHVKTHTVANAFECVLCPFKCSRKCYLLKHMRAHNGVDVYSCDSCEFKCDTYVCFMKHKNTHTYTHGNMLTCEVCSFVCVGRQVLGRHMKTHGGVSYRCAECDFKCMRKCDLVEHGKVHDEKPFSCAHCKYKCRSSKTLAKHVTEAHVGKSEVEYII